LLGIHNGELDPADALNQFISLVACKRFNEIGRNPLAKIFGLANVDQVIVYVKILVDARAVRNSKGNFFIFFLSKVIFEILNPRRFCPSL